jgi:hypothetical protein
VAALGQTLSTTDVVANNDSRLSDARTPTDGSVTRAKLAGASFQTKRVGTGSIAGGGTVTVTVTWDTAFADTNYTVALATESTDSNATSPAIRPDHIRSKTASAITVACTNADAVTARTGTVHAVAIHD